MNTTSKSPKEARSQFIRISLFMFLFSFDFCSAGEENAPSENLGQVVFGERIRASPYKVSILIWQHKLQIRYSDIWYSDKSAIVTVLWWCGFSYSKNYWIKWQKSVIVTVILLILWWKSLDSAFKMTVKCISDHHKALDLALEQCSYLNFHFGYALHLIGPKQYNLI